MDWPGLISGMEVMFTGVVFDVLVMQPQAAQIRRQIIARFIGGGDAISLVRVESDVIQCIRNE